VSRFRSPFRRRLPRRLALALALLSVGVGVPLASASPANAACSASENQLAGGAWYPDEPSSAQITPLQFEVRCDAPVKVYVYGMATFVLTAHMVQTPSWFSRNYVAVMDSFPTARITMKFQVVGAQQYLNVRITDTTKGVDRQGLLFHDLGQKFV
jgi:hypothetical protein